MADGPTESQLDDLDLLDGETEPFHAAAADATMLGLGGLPRPAVARLGAATTTEIDSGATLRGEPSMLPRAALARTAPEMPHQPPSFLRAIHVDGEGDELRVIGQIGAGGMARVELAEQRSLGREVAVKRPLAAGADHEALLHEARLTGALEHPAIVPVHELVKDADGAPAMVMKRLEGESWRAMLERDHRHDAALDFDDITRHVNVAIALCNALDYAHARKIVHLDVKPDNVMVGPYGEVWLLDWGVACRLDAADHADDEQLVGTPVYMAPEQLRGRCAVDARTDVFLLGASLHHALTGRARHGGNSIMAVVHRAHHALPYDYSSLLPDELGAILNRACAREPEHRHADAATLRRALADFLRHRDAVALSDRALVELRALESAVADLGASDATAQRAIEAMTTRVRFGFEAALHAWAEFESAKAGLRRTLVAAIEFELWRENAPAAAALLDSLDHPPQDLAARVRTLRKQAAERGDVVRQIEAMRRDLSFRGADWRSSAGMVGNGLFWASILLVLFWIEQDGRFALDAKVNLALGIAMSGLTSLLIWVVRGLLLENRIRRSFLWAIGAYLAAMVLHRVVGAIRGVSFHDGLHTDWVILFVFMAVTAALVDRSLWLSPAVCVVGAVLSAMMPLHTILIGAVAILLVNLNIAWAVRPRGAAR